MRWRSMVMKFKTLLFILVVLLLGARGVNAQTAPDSALLILAKEDNTLLIVDPGSLKVTTKLPVGPDPREVIASPDGTTAYISNYGGDAYNTPTGVDLAAKKFGRPSISTLCAGRTGWRSLAAECGLRLRVPRRLAATIPQPRGSIGSWAPGKIAPHMIYVSPDLNEIVTTNVSSASVSIIEKIGGGAATGPSSGDRNETFVPVGRGSEGFDVSPDGKEIWVANADDGTVSIIDVASNKKIIDTLAANVREANRLKFTPGGKLAFISSLWKPDVAVLDRVTRKEVKHIKAGECAAGSLMQPDGSRAYVACSPDGYVAVIDLHSLEVVGRIEAGQEPDGLAWVVLVNAECMLHRAQRHRGLS
jgi:YVTN family beta-propeller protein